MRFKIKSALICDLVRIENNGKHILIGVYLGDALFEKLPANFAPTFWVQMEPPVRGGTIDLELKIEVPERRKPLLASTQLTIAPNQTGALLVFSGAPFEVTEEGNLALSIRQKGGRWQKVIELHIGVKPTSA